MLAPSGHDAQQDCMKQLLLWMTALSLTFFTVGCDSSVNKLNNFVDSAEDPRQLNAEKLHEVFKEGAIANDCRAECMDAVRLYAALRKFNDGTLEARTLDAVWGDLKDQAPPASSCHDKLTLYSETEVIPAPPTDESVRKELRRIVRNAIMDCAQPATR